MVDVDVDDLNDTPLHLAARSGDHEDMLLILKSANCDPNAIGLYGWTALHETVAKGDLDCAAILLQHGAVPHRRDSVTRDSALHMAAKYGNTKMLQLLLQHGADLEVKNKNGEMPIDVATGKCIQLLEKYGCVKSKKTDKGASSSDKMKVTRPIDPFTVKDIGMEAYLITPEEVGLAGPVCRRCSSTGQPLPQLTLAVQYNSKDSHSTKICTRTIKDVFIPTPLMLQCTHIYMETSLQPDAFGNTRQCTERLLLNDCLIDQCNTSGTTENLKHLLPLTFTTHPVYRNIPRNKMDGLSVYFMLCLRRGYASTMTVACIDVPLSSAVKMVMPHTLYLTHTSEFLSHWRQSVSHQNTTLTRGSLS